MASNRSALLLSGLWILLAPACRPPIRQEPASSGPASEAMDGTSRQCKPEVVLVIPTKCWGAEKATSSTGTVTTIRTARCGGSLDLCGSQIACDCAGARPFFDCDPNREPPTNIEEGRPYTESELERLPPPVEANDERLYFSIKTQEGLCRIALSPPRLGICSAAGIIPGEGGEHWSASIPIGESRAVCGRQLTCRCSEFQAHEVAK